MFEAEWYRQREWGRGQDGQNRESQNEPRKGNYKQR